MALALQIDALEFSYAGRAIFAGWSHRFQQGITWLRGSNGSGKTTLLKIIGGAMATHAGEIKLGDLECAAQPLDYRRRVFLCAGETPALPWLKTRELFDLYLSLYPVVQLDVFYQHLDAFGLHAVLDQPVSTLSLGQHKKMQLAIALALPVSLLLLDEPFNGVDQASLEYLQAQLALPQRLVQQTIILTSHVQPEVAIVEQVFLDGLSKNCS
jgi:ABC-2 type transport system ATP-binding protein